jgi:hypothetical protein
MEGRNKRQDSKRWARGDLPAFRSEDLYFETSGIQCGFHIK